MIFVGYFLDHAGDVYRFYNPVTKHLIQSFDVTQWTGKPWNSDTFTYYDVLESGEENTITDETVNSKTPETPEAEETTKQDDEVKSQPKHDYNLCSMYGKATEGYQLRSKGSPTYPISTLILYIESERNLHAYEEEINKYKAKVKNQVMKKVKFSNPISTVFKTESKHQNSSKSMSETFKHLTSAPIPITIPQNYCGMLKSPEIHDWLIGQEK